jgi:hypothetical protein
VTSIVCYGVSKVRKRWFEGYMVSMESLMTCIIEKAGTNRGAEVPVMEDPAITEYLWPAKRRARFGQPAGVEPALAASGAASGGCAPAATLAVELGDGTADVY